MDNLLESIEKARRTTLPRFIASLSIPQVGEETAFDLAEHFGSVEKLGEAKYEELEAIYGVGPVVARAVTDWFKESDNRKLIRNLLKHIEIEKVKVGSKLTGKSFVFTGTMNMERDVAQARVRELGGEVSSSVSKNTTYVVAGESAGSKLDKARDLGVTILTEEEFLKLIK